MTYSERELDDIFYGGGDPVPGWPPGYIYDCDGRIVCRWEHGEYSKYGWQVDHDPPLSLGALLGGFSRLRPRHWLGNTSAGGLLGNWIKELPDNPYLGIWGAFSSDKKR